MGRLEGVAVEEDLVRQYPVRPDIRFHAVMLALEDFGRLKPESPANSLLGGCCRGESGGEAEVGENEAGAGVCAWHGEEAVLGLDVGVDDPKGVAELDGTRKLL